MKSRKLEKQKGDFAGLWNQEEERSFQSLVAFVQEQNFKRALSICFKTKIKICPLPQKSSEMYSVSLLNNLLHTVTPAHTLN